MKTLTAPELRHLQRLVEDLLEIMLEDETGILLDIDDRILIASEILEVHKEIDFEEASDTSTGY